MKDLFHITNPPRPLARFVCAAILGIAAGLYADSFWEYRQTHPSDFWQPWAAARMLAQGQNPYELIGPGRTYRPGVVSSQRRAHVRLAHDSCDSRSVQRTLGAIAVALSALTAGRVAAQEDVARILKQQTQELFDAVTAGDPRVWDRYLDANAIYLSEDGVRETKADLLKEITPLPKGISGSIVVSDFELTLHGDTAVTTHNALESENYFGHALKAEYRSTDTWVRTPQGWKLVASQVHAQPSDPPAITLAPTKLDEYVGTYRLNAEITYTIRRNGSVLTGERSGRSAQTLNAEASDVFFVAGQPRSRKIFLRSPDGRVTGFVDRRDGRDIPWTRER